MHKSPFGHYLTQCCQPEVFFFIHLWPTYSTGRTSSARGYKSNARIGTRQGAFAQSPNLFFRSNLTASPECDSRSSAVQSHRTCSAFPAISYTAFSPTKVELSGVFVLPLSPMSYTHANLHTWCDPMVLILNGSVGWDQHKCLSIWHGFGERNEGYKRSMS